MIDFKKACELALKEEGIPSTIYTAWDFGDFFLFSLAPYKTPSNIRYETGTVFTAVDKSTGRVYDYDLTSDLELFLNATVLVN